MVLSLSTTVPGEWVQGENGAGQLTLPGLIARFVGHVAAGTVGFIALAIPAVGISIAEHYLDELPVSPFVTEVLLWVHYSLLVVDTVMFAAYILASVYSAVTELLHYVRGV